MNKYSCRGKLFIADSCSLLKFLRTFFHAVFPFTLISTLTQMAFIKEVPQFTIIATTENYLHTTLPSL